MRGEEVFSVSQKVPPQDLALTVSFEKRKVKSNLKKHLVSGVLSVVRRQGEGPPILPLSCIHNVSGL